MDRITSPIRQIKSSGNYPDVKENESEKYLWGSYADENAKPEHVKIAIKGSTQNLIRKIKNDVRHREGIGSFYEKDGEYYYEDDIIGMSEFKRWLRSYGSSILVIEPNTLREDMIKTADYVLEYYKKSKDWKISF